jgi:flagellar FliL protein
MSQDDEVPAKKKKSKAKWFILLLLLILLGGGGYLLYNMGFLDKFLNNKDSDAAVSGAGSGAAGNSGTRISVPTSNLSTATFEPFLVNLSDPSGNRYINLTLAVEVISPEVIKELEVQNPRVRDALIMLLTSKTHAELSTQVGKLRLKNEILDRINQLLGGAKLTQVFLQNFVLQ